MNILLDSLSTQVLYQRAPSVLPPNAGTPGCDYPAVTGLRINTILGAMQGAGVTSDSPWVVSYSSYPITSAQLAGINVYVSMTRWKSSPFAYTSDELTALLTFVQAGGGLLLLTDHGPFSGNSTNWPVNDIALAAKFEIMLQPYGVTLNDYMSMPMDATAPAYVSNQVSAIAAHDSCIIMEPAVPFTPIAQFPADAVEWNAPTNPGENGTPTSPYFCILVPWESGNVIVVGNSGMFCDYGTPNPSCGMAPIQNNLLFFLNCVSYLGGLRTPPVPGACP